MSKEKKQSEKFDFKQLQSFEDFCKARNIDPTQLPGVDNLPEEFRAPLISVYKLMVAISAVNKGEKVDFTNRDTAKFYPWVQICSSGSGFAFSFSDCGCGYSGSDAGSRLCTDDPEKTMHVLKVMEEDYKNWLI